MCLEDDISRFMRSVDKLPNGCWFWTGGRSRGKGNKRWYGSFSYKGKTVRAHVFSCDVIGKKVVPKGWHRDHTCVFSLCVNFDHIDPVLPAINQERKVSRTLLRRAASASLECVQEGGSHGLDGNWVDVLVMA